MFATPYRRQRASWPAVARRPSPNRHRKIQTESITRFSRSQLIQLILLGALVYVAYPFIGTVLTFFNALARANWWWALLVLAISASTYVGAAAALWASADKTVKFWRLRSQG